MQACIAIESIKQEVIGAWSLVLMAGMKRFMGLKPVGID
jgi:hypothetical protein